MPSQLMVVGDKEEEECSSRRWRRRLKMPASISKGNVLRICLFLLLVAAIVSEMSTHEVLKVPKEFLPNLADKEEAKMAWDTIKAACGGHDRVHESNLPDAEDGIRESADGRGEAVDDFSGCGMLLASDVRTLGEKVLEIETARETREMLKTMHVGAECVKKAEIQTLKFEFERLCMRDAETDFAAMLTVIVNKIRASGGKMEEIHVVKLLLRFVSVKFLHIVSTMERFGDPNMTKVQKVIGSLKVQRRKVGIQCVLSGIARGRERKKVGIFVSLMISEQQLQKGDEDENFSWDPG